MEFEKSKGYKNVKHNGKIKSKKRIKCITYQKSEKD